MPANNRFYSQDLLANRPSANADLNANNGRVGCLSPDGQHFITSLTDVPSIPAPPTGDVHVFADGHFGVHDPTRAPQFYNDLIPHFAVFPTFPTNEDHPYFSHRHMWTIPQQSDIDWSVGRLVGVGLLQRRFYVKCRAAVFWAIERAEAYIESEKAGDHPNLKMLHFLDMRIPRLRHFLHRLESVANNLTSIRISINGLLRLWLDVSAGVDWVTLYQRVLRQHRHPSELSGLPLTIGVFTDEHHIVEMFSSIPNIPVYYVRPLEHFNTQRILKVVPLVKPPAYLLPQTPYPTIFSGSGDDPAKLGSEIRFHDRFLRLRCNAFDFKPSPATVIPSLPTASTSSSFVGPSRSTRSTKSARDQSTRQTKKPKATDPKARNTFEDCTRAPYSPPLHPGWSGINLDIKTEVVDEKRRFQRQRNEPLLTAKYMLPPPGLFLRKGIPDEQFASFYAQYDHLSSALLYRLQSQHSKAPALSNQEWRDVLFLPRQHTQEEGELTTHRAQALAKIAASLGNALSSGGVQFDPVCATPVGGFALPSLDAGRRAMWCLFEMSFRFELVLLDGQLRGDSSQLEDADEEAAAREARHADILGLFPEESILAIDPLRSREGLCSNDWASRAERLEKLRRIVGLWHVEKAAILKAPFSTRESVEGLAQERALALLYAQTFFDTYERPAILPRAWWP